MIKAVLFDMDGTVFDTEKIYYRSWLRAADAVNFEGNMADVMPLIFGVSEEDIGKYFYQNYGEDFPYPKMLSLRAAFIAEEIEQKGVPRSKLLGAPSRKKFRAPQEGTTRGKAEKI